MESIQSVVVRFEERAKSVKRQLANSKTPSSLKSEKEEMLIPARRMGSNLDLMYVLPTDDKDGDCVPIVAAQDIPIRCRCYRGILNP